MSEAATGLVWLRRDLRLSDHSALAAAQNACARIWCVFVFDEDILAPLRAGPATPDRRVEFIVESLLELDGCLREHGSELIVRHGHAAEEIVRLAEELGVTAVYASGDYEKAALARDAAVAAALERAGRTLLTYKDQVVFERDEIMTAAGRPYTVFTPYRRAWRAALKPEHYAERVVDLGKMGLAARPAHVRQEALSLAATGFAPTNLREVGIEPGARSASRALSQFLERIDHYAERRDYPAVKGPSYLSVHLRFGTVSIRALVRAALDRIEAGSRGGATGGATADGTAGAETWLSELIWREFYAQILFHRPDVEEHAFRPEYDAIAWHAGAEADQWFAAWCRGATGYPLVDAAMHQINQTGYMHNRLRMVTASFLVKDLGIDWRRGEAYFARLLNDFDLASNNGGWQWAASTGCDAQPYFRIFNPVTQSQRFDPEGKFIRRYLPCLAALSASEIHAPWLTPPEILKAKGVVLGETYPRPLVDHAQARVTTLARYGVVKDSRAA